MRAWTDLEDRWEAVISIINIGFMLQVRFAEVNPFPPSGKGTSDSNFLRSTFIPVER